MWRTAALLVLMTPALAGCYGTVVKDLASDPATVRIRMTTIYGVLEIDRTNIVAGTAEIEKDGVWVTVPWVTATAPATVPLAPPRGLRRAPDSCPP